MTEKSLILLPSPRQITYNGGSFKLEDKSLIVISAPLLLFEAQMAQSAVEKNAGLHLPIVSGKGYPNTALILAIDTTLTTPEGYQLTISANGILIAGADKAAVFYGVCTLRQILQQSGSDLPCLTIQDWPDYPARGVMLDISRDKVPTLQTVLDLVDRLASWKINQLQLYMEHTFAYQNHPDVWAKASPFTGQEILELDAYCRERHIELVPNQNSLGHMERWLKHPRYHDLAECPDGFEPPWGGFLPATTLNPLDPGSIVLIRSMYDELLPHFTSQRFNVGGDEPWELGKGKSKSEIEARGGRVYLEYLLKLHQAVTEHGRKMQFWADIIVHYPDLVPELPKDITAMLWGYEGGEDARKEWERQAQMVSSAGVPFYVCPGTSSWNTIAGRSDNTLDNCLLAAEIGLKYGSVGYLNTDWGDSGHWQPLPVSYVGFAYGAGISWCIETNKNLDVPAVLNHFAFEDTSEVMGQLAFELGNIYKLIGPDHINGQVLFYSLQVPHEKVKQSISQHETWARQKADLSSQNLQKAITRIDEVLNPLENATMSRTDADLIAGEFVQAADLLRHSARRLLLLNGESSDTPQELAAELETLLERQRANWLARNRPGGLEDSLQRFDSLMNDYRPQK